MPISGPNVARPMSPARTTLVALLVLSTALFVVGVIAERSQSETHREPTAGQQHSEASGSEGAHEGGEQAGSAEGAQGEHADTGGEATHADEREQLLGVDLESTPLLIVAVIAGLGLAATCSTRLGDRPGVLLAVAAIALAWAALDVREVVHQLDESNTGLALIAIGTATLHAAAAALAAKLSTQARRADARSPGSAGTMPA